MISTSKNSATITENNVTIKLSTGCKQHGLKHILLRHFCDDCEGKVSAIDIISLERFFKQINSYNGKNGKTGYIYKKDESNKYLLLVFKDINSDGVISVFKMDRIENVVEIGEGAISPEENFGNLSGELRKTK